MNNLNIDTSKSGWRKKQSIKQKHFQVFSPCVQASNHYLQRGYMAAPTVMKTSTVFCLQAALEHFEQSGWTLRSVTATCKNKDLIKTPVWKYSGAFWKNSLCEQWWGTLAMTQRSLKACQLFSVPLKSALQQLLLLRWRTLIHWLTWISSTTSDIHSISQHRTRHVVCEILTINTKSSRVTHLSLAEGKMLNF